jgi:hypothetical protein
VTQLGLPLQGGMTWRAKARLRPTELAALAELLEDHARRLRERIRPVSEDQG